MTTHNNVTPKDRRKEKIHACYYEQASHGRQPSNNACILAATEIIIEASTEAYHGRYRMYERERIHKVELIDAEHQLVGKHDASA